MKTIKIYLICILLLANVLGCSKFVDVGLPATQLTTESTFNNNETAIAAAMNIYVNMMDKDTPPFRMALITGLGGDELRNYSLSSGNVQAYNNLLRPIDSYTNSLWLLAYNLIYQANALFEGCEKSTALNSAVKQQLMAEARFIRAYWYFYLVNLCGDVPLITSTDYLVNATIPRTATSTVYDQIIKDLLYAQNNLNDNYVQANSTGASEERVRPNKVCATAMLARVYLYVRNYVDAERQSSDVINRSNTYVLAAIDKVFLKESKEAIWQLAKPTPTNNRNTHEGNGFILTSRPSTGASASATISTSLLGSFDNADKRKTTWISKFTDRTVTPNVDYYFPFKYKVRTAATVTEYSIVLRLAEQYLIRAEARAQLDRLSEAIDDLDMVRGRAGITLIKTTNPTIGKEELLNVILKERQRELFTEWGHRWLDLKRLNKLNEVMAVASIDKGTTWSSAMQLWPIPLETINNAPQIQQNPSYN